MTLSEIEAVNANFLTAAQVAPILGADPNLIRYQARNAPQKLGFPVVVIGTRVKIPKIPFLKFMRGELVYQDVTQTKLTREQQQYILNILAELCSEQAGVEITFTLDEEIL